MAEWCDALNQECVEGDVENCFHCLPFMATCDECHVSGHKDSAGWHGVEIGNGMKILCDECYDKQEGNDGA